MEEDITLEKARMLIEIASKKRRDEFARKLEGLMNEYGYTIGAEVIIGVDGKIRTNIVITESASNNRNGLKELYNPPENTK